MQDPVHPVSKRPLTSWDMPVSGLVTIMGTSSCRLLPDPRTTLKHLGPIVVIEKMLCLGSVALGVFLIFFVFLEEELSTGSRRPRSLGDASSVNVYGTKGVDSTD